MSGYRYGASLTRDQVKDRRIAALEREAAQLRRENQALRQRTTAQITLHPGDTPEVCAARLEAAAAEVGRLRPQGRRHRHTPTRKAAA